MKKLVLLAGIIALFTAVGCEMHPPRPAKTEGKDSVIDQVKQREDIRTEGANPNPPQFFTPTPTPQP